MPGLQCQELMGATGCGDPRRPFVILSLLQPVLIPHPALHKMCPHTGCFPRALDPAEQLRQCLMLSLGSICLLCAPQRLSLGENFPPFSPLTPAAFCHFAGFQFGAY